MVEDTLECIASLKSLSFRNSEIWVIDNGSRAPGLSDNPSRDFFYVKNPENLGFAAGNNVGISCVLEKGVDYIFILNNDTIVHPEVVSQLVEIVERDKQIGMVGPKICYLYEPDRVWFAGVSIDFTTGDSPHWGRENSIRDNMIALWKLIDCAGVRLVKAEVIRKIGMLVLKY